MNKTQLIGRPSVGIVTVILPALWSSALVNNDWSGLKHYYPDEASKAKFWQIESGLDVLSCSEDSFSAEYAGMLTECLEYQCVPKGVSYE